MFVNHETRPRGLHPQHVVTLVCADAREAEALARLFDGLEPTGHTDCALAHELQRALPVRGERRWHEQAR